LRICEHELLVDEVLCLLKRLDLVMAMRLHAAIFSLAADVPTIGIDYRVGRPGKVTELFVERGLARQVRRIDILDADWLAGQLVDSSRVAVAADRQR
jgi:polysaccharide pyruvyl transferase WcaK-like protein